jgi:Family of unknown function (DUF6977)
VASRPVFIPNYEGALLVQERLFDFPWASGFAESQKKKNVAALHDAAKRAGIARVLEISTKSGEKVGRRLSAFSLKIEIDGVESPLESVYQGSKVFERCGPSPQIFDYEPRDAKRFMRELDCGHLIGFELEGQRYPLVPKNGFYDWLYIRALAKHVDWINENVSYDAYTDIEFNPEKQVNCQARAFAEFKSLAAKSELGAVVRDFHYFASMLLPI